MIGVFLFYLAFSRDDLTDDIAVGTSVKKVDRFSMVQFFAGYVCVGFVQSIGTSSWLGPVSSSMAIEAYFFVIVISHNCGLLFRWACLYLFLMFIAFTVVCYTKMGVMDAQDLVEMLVVMTVCFFVQLIALRTHDQAARKSFYLNRRIRLEHNKATSLLESMVPVSVLDELRTGRMSVAYEYTDMSLLFADIVGFTKYASSVSAKQVVLMLTNLFGQFDSACAELGLYKVHTIGDAYVVVNQPTTRESLIAEVYIQCVACLRMALRMLQTIRMTREAVSFPQLDMRIGLHLGKFVAGVIGINTIRFDIWGTDVLAGNMVESSGLAGSVCVSQPYMDILSLESEKTEASFVFTYKCDIKADPDNSIAIYVVSGPAIDAYLSVESTSSLESPPGLSAAGSPHVSPFLSVG